MVKKREVGFVRIIKEPALSRMKNNQCPSCGKPKNKWTRRTDWRCCSTGCTEKSEDFCIIRNWRDLRERAFKRDNHTCVKCKKKVEKNDYGEYPLIGDHIIPIALGGEQWDINNVQTLCIACDKIKTKQDAKDIAKQRRKEKMIKSGQITLPSATSKEET